MRSQLDRFHRAQRSGSEEQDPQRASHDVAHTHTPHTLARRLPGGPGGFLLRHPAPPSRTARSSARTDGGTEALAARPLFCGRLGAYGLYSWGGRSLCSPLPRARSHGGFWGDRAHGLWFSEKNLTAILDRAGITCRGARGHGGTRACPAPASAESRESRQRHSRVAAPAVQHIYLHIVARSFVFVFRDYFMFLRL